MNYVFNNNEASIVRVQLENIQMMCVCRLILKFGSLLCILSVEHP